MSWLTQTWRRLDGWLLGAALGSPVCLAAIGLLLAGSVLPGWGLRHLGFHAAAAGASRLALAAVLAGALRMVWLLVRLLRDAPALEQRLAAHQLLDGQRSTRS